MKTFNPTHIFHYSAESKCRQMFPKGIPVVKGFVDESGMVEWLSDAEGNVGGYAYENASYVIPIDSE